jgi:hypothetical protein
VICSSCKILQEEESKMEITSIFSTEEIRELVTCWRMEAGGLMALSFHQKGLLDADAPRLEKELDGIRAELDGYLDRYNAALAAAGEDPSDLQGLMAAATGGGLVPMC